MSTRSPDAMRAIGSIAGCQRLWPISGASTSDRRRSSSIRRTGGVGTVLGDTPELLVAGDVALSVAAPGHRRRARLGDVAGVERAERGVLVFHERRPGGRAQHLVHDRP